MDYEPVIGLEVHAQLKTESKIFCSCSTAFGATPNSHVCPICLGMPGTLPKLNKTCVEFIIRLGLATGCEITPRSISARKNYFYPDLPKGYQISQYELPVAEHGRLTVEVNGADKTFGITRCHLEEDAGKLVHDDFAPVSFVDLNRCGTPLIEIVSEPDMRSSDDAVAYLKSVREMVRYLDICDGNMEQGSLRCDANISLRPFGQEKLGTRAELKNMNSFKAVGRAIEYEIRRQRAVLDSGEKVVQETRLWDADKGESFSMRGKEEAHDYRYFPDPDLLPIVIDEAWIDRVRQEMPELPQARRERFVEQYGLPEYDSGVLCADKAVADYFEEVAEVSSNTKSASNWIMTELLAALKHGGELSDIKIKAADLGKLIALVDEGKISGKMAKEVFEAMAEKGQGPEEIIEAKGLKQISDSSELEGMIDKIIADNQDSVEKYRSGAKKVFGFFVGQVMKASRGQANPQVVNELLKKRLDS